MVAVEKTMDNVIIFPVYIDTHITALEFFETILFAGEGGTLCVYNVEKWSLMFQQELLHGCNIHGIRINEPVKSGAQKLCVFGGRCLRVVQFTYLNNIFQLSDMCDVITFEDWVWDVRWFCHNAKKGIELLAASLGHNSLILMDWKSGRLLQTVKCEDTCLLYSAAIVGSTLETLTVIAGTVFREVIIWSAQGTELSPGCKKIAHHLEGHEGVIFSVTYNSLLRLICSTSDDRSVRIWRVASTTLRGTSDLSASEWEQSQIYLQCILYGHMARVWKAMCLLHCLVSVGEDSVLCIWDYEGTMLQKVRGHHGANIWSLAVNSREDWLATGGGDAGIRLWPITPEALASKAASTPIILPFEHSAMDGKLRGKPDFPRVVSFLDPYHLLIMTNEGILYCHSRKTGQWCVLLKDPTYHSYSLMVAAPWGRHVAMGNISGQLLIIDTDECDGLMQAFRCVREQVYSDKILSIIWLDKQHLLTCGSQGNMLLWLFLDTSNGLQLSLLHHFLLPPCKQRWVSAATLLPRIPVLVVGDRCGTVHTYDCSPQIKSSSQPFHLPLQSFTRIHGKTGVTDVRYHHGYLYTAGRDGVIHMYCVKGLALEELRSVKASGGLDWIAKLMFPRDSLIVLGFHTKNFVLWSWEQQRSILSIPCGGGHRSWDFKLVADSARLVYVRNGTVHHSELKAVLHMSPTLKNSNHSRAITCIRYLFTVRKDSELFHLCATASEDITVKIIAFGRNKLSSGVYPFARHDACVLQGHISSVRTIATCPFYYMEEETKEGKPKRRSLVRRKKRPDLLMFSAGGRAQVKVWHLVGLDVPLENGEYCSSQLLASHMLKEVNPSGHKPWRTSTSKPETETRYMDFTAFGVSEINASLPTHLYLAVGACSDGLLRVFGFNYKSKKLHLLAALAHHEHCILKISHFFVRHQGLVELVVVSAATDGNLAFWNLTDLAIAFSDAEVRIAGDAGSSQEENEKWEEDGSSYDSDTSSVPSIFSLYKREPNHWLVGRRDSNSLTNRVLKVDSRNIGILESSVCDQSPVKGNNSIDPKVTVIPNELVDGFTYKLRDGKMMTSSPSFTIATHQSGINSLAIQEVTGDTILLVTGGDDNALRTMVLRVSPCPPLPNIKVDVLASHYVDSAHAAQITAIKCLSENVFATASIDQRVNLWHWSLQSSQLEVKMAASKFSNVADISSMETWPDSKSNDRGCHLVCVVGEGLQVFQCCLPQPPLERLI